MADGYSHGTPRPVDPDNEAARLGRERQIAALERDAKHALLTVAILVRKLGGTVTITNADLAAENAHLMRAPAADGFVLTISPEPSDA